MPQEAARSRTRLPRLRRTVAGLLAGLRAVLERDFLYFTSQKRFLAVRWVAVAIPALIVGAIAIGEEGHRPDDVGQALLAGALATVPALVLLLSPALAASAIAGERSTDTLDLVLAAPVSATSFVLAKFGSRLATVLVLILATLPVASVALVYGGVSLGLFLDFVAFSVALAIWGVAAGIGASAFMRSVAGAVLCAFALAILVPAFYTAATTAIINEVGGNWPARKPLLDAWLGPTPYYAWAGIFEDGLRRGTSTGRGMKFLTASTVLAAIALAAAAWRLAREARFRTAGKRRKAQRDRPMFRDDPVLDRALRGSLLLRPRAGAWAMLAIVLAIEGCVLGIAAAENDLHHAEVHVFSLCAITGVVFFYVIAHAANGVATERKQGSLGLLMATPLDSQHVVMGKFLSSLLAAAPFLTLAFVHGFLAVSLTDLSGESVLAWMMTTAATVLLAAAVALRISIRAPTPGRSVLLSYGVLLGGPVLHGALGIVALIVTQGGAVEGWMFYFAASPPVLVVSSTAIAHEAFQPNRFNNNDFTMLLACTLWTIVWSVLAYQLVRRAGAALDDSRD